MPMRIGPFLVVNDAQVQVGQTVTTQMCKNRSKSEDYSEDFSYLLSLFIIFEMLFNLDILPSSCVSQIFIEDNQRAVYVYDKHQYVG